MYWDRSPQSCQPHRGQGVRASLTAAATTHTYYNQQQPFLKLLLVDHFHCIEAADVHQYDSNAAVLH